MISAFYDYAPIRKRCGLSGQNVVENVDCPQGITRTEVRSKDGDNHFGHGFPDGPCDKGGLRYCINSASVRFIYHDQLASEGYSAYAKLFAKQGGLTRGWT